MKRSDIQVGKTYCNKKAGRTRRTVIGIGDEFKPEHFFSSNQPPNEPGVEYKQEFFTSRLYISAFASWAGKEVDG